MQGWLRQQGLIVVVFVMHLKIVEVSVTSTQGLVKLLYVPGPACKLSGWQRSNTRGACLVDLSLYVPAPSECVCAWCISVSMCRHEEGWIVPL